MTDKNMASFAVTPHLIAAALHMPEGHEIVGAQWDFESRTVRLFVEGPDLPTVKLGEIIPSVTPEISEHYDPATNEREYEWNWGISS